MIQQIQQKQPIKDQLVQQIKKPVQPATEQQPKIEGEKKSRWWIWLLVAIVVVAIGLFLWIFN